MRRLGPQAPAMASQPAANTPQVTAGLDPLPPVLCTDGHERQGMPGDLGDVADGGEGALRQRSSGRGKPRHRGRSPTPQRQPQGR